LGGLFVKTYHRPGRVCKPIQNRGSNSRLNRWPIPPVQDPYLRLKTTPMVIILAEGLVAAVNLLDAG
jgi:hypothetical protein